MPDTRAEVTGAESYFDDRMADPDYALAYWHARAHTLDPTAYGPLTFNADCEECRRG